MQDNIHAPKPYRVNFLRAKSIKQNLFYNKSKTQPIITEEFLAHNEVKHVLSLPTLRKCSKASLFLGNIYRKSPAPLWCNEPPLRETDNPIVKDDVFQEIDESSDSSTCDSSVLFN